jgi:hypothetical protein
MKAYKYTVIVSIDPVHSWGDRPITEYFMPQLNLCFNSEGFAFNCDKPRNEVYEETSLPDWIIIACQDYIDSHESILKWFEKDIDKNK